MLRRGLSALAAGKRDEARRQFEAAAQADPMLAEAQFRLGNLLRESGDASGAEQCYRRAVAARPDHAEAAANLGALLKDRGRDGEAAVFLEQAVRAMPKLAAASYNLAMLRINEGRWSDAVTLLKAACEADPKDADTHYWLGNAAMGTGDAAAAREAYRAALRVNANHVQARWGFAMAQIPAVADSAEEQRAAPEAFAREVGKLKDWFRTRRPTDAFRAVGAQQPYYLAYVPLDHRTVLSEYGELCTSLMGAWARKAGVPAPVRSTGSKCRVGIVSAHVHSHSVWHALLRGWVEHLDRGRFDVQLFHTGKGRDAETEWAAGRVSRLHHAAQDWTAWSKTIFDAGLDVLIYPEIGMDSTTVRLASLRLAPRQFASWGHPLTSGLPTIDGYISAEGLEPPDAARHYSERLITLPRLGSCYQPFGTRPAPVDLSAHGIGPGERFMLCAGTPFKYAPADDSLWVAVARQCAPVRLVFFRSQPQSLSDRLEARLRGAFEAAGLAFEQHVRFVPWQSQAAFFALLDRADAYLDTVGFSGFNTTLQAIERGTRVVAWEGEFLRGRFASGILRQMGLDDWVAGSHEQFAALAQRLCADRALRDSVRGAIATRRAALFDDRATVAELGDALIESLAASRPAG